MRQPRSEFEALERLTLVDGYGDMIRVARQRENMTVDVLAKKIAEKESVVKNLEKEELVPDRALIQKLRNVLKIELLVPEESAPAPKASKPSAERTLGDLIKQKQSAKAESQGTEELEEG
jgi:putative transcription factor